MAYKYTTETRVIYLYRPIFWSHKQQENKASSKSNLYETIECQEATFIHFNPYGVNIEIENEIK